ncbi:DNA-binding MarR family transcriptional regulator [Neorhizobium huautlense]|uniref:DNA-binding MarR family transcriptional regulator n=1 Tax=Neorhizobium huautlense TaxID=67774 RepID=A0ABT9PMV7_9HYPH|nr:MarR family transcriptional regulator [Neorhizobium huautlense]MDP9835796.1 DNA-binding MarR family transcriptional regulator [Neorhizobium huautlense]
MSTTEKTAAQIGLDQMLCFAVYKAEQAFNRVYRQALEPLGLTYPQFLTMRLLWSEGSLSVGEISERLGLDSGTVTPLLKRLSLMGLVKKARRADDERRVDIFLTDEGRALEAKSEAVMQCIARAAAVDGEEGDDMLSTINRLIANLNHAAEQ